MLKGHWGPWKCKCGFKERNQGFGEPKLGISHWLPMLSGQYVFLMLLALHGEKQDHPWC